MFVIKCYWMLQNSKVTTFTVSELLKENQQGGGGKLPLTPSPRIGLTNWKYSFKISPSFETDLSEHHYLIYSMLKTTFHKVESKMLIYRNYKMLSLEKFSSELFSKLESQENNDYETCEKILLTSWIIKLEKSQKSFELTRSLILIILLWNVS